MNEKMENNEITFGWTAFTDRSGVKLQFNAQGWGEMLDTLEATDGYEDKKTLPLLKLAKFGNLKTNRGSLRHNANIQVLYGIEGDYDGGEVSMQDAAARLAALGVRCALYASPSWTPEHPRWRVLAPFSAPVTVGQVMVRERMMARLNGALGGILAGESFTASQAFYFGYVEGGHREPYIRVKEEGGWFIDQLAELDKNAKGRPSRLVTGEAQGRVVVDDSLFAERVAELGRLLGDGERRDLFRSYLSAKSRAGASVAEMMAMLRGVVDQYSDPAHPVDWKNLREIAEDFYERDRGVRAEVEGSGLVQGLVKKAEPAPLADPMAGREVSGESGSGGNGSGTGGTSHEGMITLRQAMRELVHIAQGARVVYYNYPRFSMTFPEADKYFAGSLMKVDAENPMRVFQVWATQENRLQAKLLTFAPGEGRFTTQDGLSALNTYIPLPEPKVLGEEAVAGARVFIEHIEWLWGEQAGVFLDWLAHIEQNPGERVQTAWLHIAPNQGMGRNWIAGVLRRVWGEYVAPNVDLVEILDGGFNSAISEKLLAVVDEIDEADARDAAKHAQRFKALQTAETIQINVKYGAQSIQRNCIRWLIFSNHRSALPLNKNDRRVNVAECLDQPKSKEYYRKLYKLREDEGFIQAVRGMLRGRDLSGFNAGERAAVSGDKQKVIASMNTREDRVLDMLVREWPGDLITASALMGALFYNVPAEDRKYKLMAIRNKLETHGVFKVTSGGKYINIGEKKYTLYALRDAAGYNALDFHDLRYWFENKNNGAPLDDMAAHRFVVERMGDEDH